MVKAYNNHDAKAVAALFTRDGIIIDEEGHTAQGRGDIERVFASAFEKNPKTKMDISIEAIRLTTPTMAVEEGTSTILHSEDATPSRSRYTVVHAKQEGQWQMALAEDHADEAATAESELAQLGWLVGEWVDESPDGMVKIAYRWTDNHVYIVSDFSLHIGREAALTGTQRLCWDPLANKVRSWIFDSEGGFTEGLWTRDGDRWVVKLNGVTRTGLAGSSTNIIKRLSGDRYSWQARDRVMGDEMAKDTAEIVVVRRAPGPESAALPSK